MESYRKVPPICLIVAFLGCAESSVPAGPPVIYFAEIHRDLGEVPVDCDENRTISFPFENRGASLLEIQRLEASCGCTYVAITDDRLEPGEKSDIRVTVRSAGAQQRSAGVAVLSNDPANPRIQLRVSWQGVAPLECRPREINLGKILPGESAERIIEVVRRAEGDSACRIERVECVPPEQITVHRISGKHVAADKQNPAERFRVHLVASEERGERAAQVHFQLADCWRARLVVPVHWKVRHLIEVSPSHLLLSAGKAGVTRSGQVVVSGPSGKELHIEQIKFKETFGKADADLQPLGPDCALVSLALMLPPEPGVHTTDLEIHCKQPVEKTILVPISVYVFTEVAGKAKAHRTES